MHRIVTQANAIDMTVRFDLIPAVRDISHQLASHAIRFLFVSEKLSKGLPFL